MSRLAVVCGGSRGIGRAACRLLAQRGCRLAVISRHQDAARATVASLHGANHVAFSCDVSIEQEVHKTFETIQKTCGNISYLVNAAGINRDALLMRMKPEDMMDLLHTNLLGTMLTCRAALRRMLHSQGAAIVNIGSVVGLKGNIGQCVYSASKAGLEGFTRSLAKEVASRNIRVNLLAPGKVQHPLFLSPLQWIFFIFLFFYQVSFFFFICLASHLCRFYTYGHDRRAEGGCSGAVHSSEKIW
uniref:3-ketoacyl-[acyl-carrier-protein] reductase beta subunit n=1 Tax=Echeneis naucrates TaxID=173247 RepID=A0A665TFK7_ECHNA